MRIARITASAILTLFFGMLASPVVWAEPAPFAPQPFSDVPASHPSYDAIEYLRQQNILRGYPDGTFKPDLHISRAEAAVLMTNPFFLQGENLNDCVATYAGDDGTVLFPDIHDDDWFAAAVCTAKQRALINGYPNGEFRPGHTVIFAEAAKIAARVFLVSSRQDDPTDERWYTAYILALGERNAIPPSVRSLTQAPTRGEMAEMLYRLKRGITDKPFTSSSVLLDGR